VTRNYDVDNLVTKTRHDYLKLGNCFTTSNTSLPSYHHIPFKMTTVACSASPLPYHDEFLARRRVEQRVGVEPFLSQLISSLDNPPRTTFTDLETNPVPVQLSNLDVFVRRSAVETDLETNPVPVQLSNLDVFVRRSAVETPTQEIEGGVDFQRCSSFEPINHSPDPNRMFKNSPPPPIIRGVSLSEILDTTTPAKDDAATS
jgi:hypothetical protein